MLTNTNILQRTKICPGCSKPYGPEDLACASNFPRQVYCSQACLNDAHKRRPFNEQNFWDNFDRIPWSGCWIWMRATFHADYGCVLWWPEPGAPKRLTGIHRVAWWLTNGPIPKGMEVMHSCDVRTCGNPSHLTLGTHAENMADCASKRRHQHGERCIHAVLTEAQAREVLREFKWIGKRKTNAPELALKYGVRPGAIRALAKGRSWAYLQENNDAK